MDFIETFIKYLSNKKLYINDKNYKEFIKYFFCCINQGFYNNFTAEKWHNILSSLYKNAKTRSISSTNIVVSPIEKKNSRSYNLTIISKYLPFFESTLNGFFHRNNIKIEVFLHPLVYIARDKKGQIKSFKAPKEIDRGKDYEYVVYAELYLNQSSINNLKKDILQVLDTLTSISVDWKVMESIFKGHILSLNNLNEPKYKKNNLEIIEFIRWLIDGHFTFLGYGEYIFTQKQWLQSNKKGLGLLKDKDFVSLYKLFYGFFEDKKFHLFMESEEKFFVKKSTLLSVVHRNVPMDIIGLKTFDISGKLIKIEIFLGLFTSELYDNSCRDIPFLRNKVKDVIKSCQYPTFYWYKQRALSHIIDSIPRDLIFDLSNQKLKELSLKILLLQNNPKISYFIYYDFLDRYFYILVFIPKNIFYADLCEKILFLIKQNLPLDVSMVESQFGDFPFANIFYRISANEQNTLEKFDQKLFLNQLQKICFDWDQEFYYILNKSESTSYQLSYQELYRIYKSSFPSDYKQAFTAKEALEDITCIEQLYITGKRQFNVYYSSKNDVVSKIRIKIFNLCNPILLSDTVPLLENLGFLVVSERTFSIEREEKECVFMHDILVLSKYKQLQIITQIKKLIIEFLYDHSYGFAENDLLNSLILKCNLGWQKVFVFRAYISYYTQISRKYSSKFFKEALIEYSLITAKMWDWIELLFSPDVMGKKIKIKLCRDEINSMIEGIEYSNYYEIMNILRNLISSTARINYFQAKDKQNFYLSLKFKCKEIYNIQNPVPLYEIFVFSKDMEAIHMRSDNVARGGIRWSERKEDYRTEVLDLLKSQIVKNAIIIPKGAKGVFIVKNILASDTKNERYNKVSLAYEWMIRGILDLTDNIIEYKVVKPENVICYDEDDPYLCVAADKGTSHFSDLANRIAGDYLFWMRDAFASGGSEGYDHKKIGITSGGVWEILKNHLLSLKFQEDAPITMIGVGDMSGDVFGNGLIYNKKTILLAAFNHEYIFLDPNPDIITSYTERLRLFNNELSWDKYNKSFLSKGGGIFSRKEKNILLTATVKKLLKTTKNNLTPNEVIYNILKINCDILWFGGIGTFIKSKMEYNYQVGDVDNDAIRVDAHQIKAKIISEGANLGVTDRGRLELCLNNKIVNADFIDNSGGVNCSDYEVNIKILLYLINLPNIEYRNILKRLEPEVKVQVLYNCRVQNYMIDLLSRKGQIYFDYQVEFLRFIEKKFKFSRIQEGFRSDEEIKQLQFDEKKFTRTEICKLVSFAKNHISLEILTFNKLLPKYFDQLLDIYFPSILQETKYKQHFNKHPLKKNIIATQIANDIVNFMGPSYYFELNQNFAVEIDNVVKVFYIVIESFDIRKLWDILDKFNLQIDYLISVNLRQKIMKIIRRSVHWLIKKYYGKLDFEKTKHLFSSGFKELSSRIEECFDKQRKENYYLLIKKYKSSGLPKEHAISIAQLELISAAPDMIYVADQLNICVFEAIKLYFLIGKRFYFDRYRTYLESFSVTKTKQRISISGMIEDLYHAQEELTRSIFIKGLKDKNKLGEFDEHNFIKNWEYCHKNLCQSLKEALSKQNKDTNDIVSLGIIVRKLRLFSQEKFI